MKASSINTLLSKHPYYSKLSDSNRLIVLNLALSNYWNALDEVVYPSVLSAGKVGASGAIIEYPSIYRLPQRFSASLSLSSYSNILNQLSFNEYASQLDDNSKKIIFSIAIQKVAQQIPSYYSVENHTGDIEYNIDNAIAPVLSAFWHKLPMINHYLKPISLTAIINHILLRPVYAIASLTGVISYILKSPTSVAASLISSIQYAIINYISPYTSKLRLGLSVLYKLPIINISGVEAMVESEIAYIVRTSETEPTETKEHTLMLPLLKVSYIFSVT